VGSIPTLHTPCNLVCYKLFHGVRLRLERKPLKSIDGRFLSSCGRNLYLCLHLLTYILFGGHHLKICGENNVGTLARARVGVLLGRNCP
jgi:hypothetical protein